MELHKYLLFSAVSLILVSGVVQSMDHSDEDLKSEDNKWKLYERWRSYHKKAEASEAEKKKRFAVFKANLDHVDKTNKMKKKYSLHLNMFADMTMEEFSKYKGFRSKRESRVLGEKASNKTRSFKYANRHDLPPEKDWRNENVLPPAKNQGQCGSCWSFGITGALEAAYAIQNKQVVPLSEQLLVDCDVEAHGGSNGGCNGGVPDYAFDFLKKNGGTMTEADYPYKMAQETCCQSGNKVAAIESYENVPVDDEEALMQAVAGQPASVAIDTKNQDFMMYKEGVLTAGACGKIYDHSVVCVGYGTAEDGTPVWIVRNSWGEDWGEKGHIRMQRNIPDPAGICGITLEVSYPNLVGCGANSEL